MGCTSSTARPKKGRSDGAAGKNEARYPVRVVLLPRDQHGLGIGSEEEAQYLRGAKVVSLSGDAWLPVFILFVGSTLYVYDLTHETPLVSLQACKVLPKRSLDETNGDVAVIFAPGAPQVWVRAEDIAELGASVGKWKEATGSSAPSS